PADRLLEGAMPGKYLGLVGLYAAAQLQVARSGAVLLKLMGVTGPPDAAIWIDGKAQKAGPELTTDLAAGRHTIVLRLDPKKLPDVLRLEASAGTFLAN